VGRILTNSATQDLSLGDIPISIDALYPLSFEAAAPAAGPAAYVRDPAIRLVVDFFQRKGLRALKLEDREETWYQDWIDYQARNGLYAGLLSPKRYSKRGSHFSMAKLTRFGETLSYFGPAHAYSLQVSFLGLFPILMCSNEALKKEAIAKLENGGLFAFAVSEQAHGSDLFANEFTVTPTGDSDAEAKGSKYYIGNVNAASMITILGKKGRPGAADRSKRAPFIFFALRPRDTPAFQNMQKIRTLGIRSAFVGGFDIKDHTVPESDVISRDREAWEAVFTTVNLGKFFLGFGSIGICEHALAEALAHMGRRALYGKSVLDMAHIRSATAAAFTRLTAMKFYAYRALDYLQIADKDDRRFLLFHAVQKAKVSTEGVKVMALLSECIGARAFESDTYFESALREVPMIPLLEGSTHINFGLTAQFIGNYFVGQDGDVPFPESLSRRDDDPGENPYWMQAGDRNAKTVRFAHYEMAYRPLRAVANVRLFVSQLRAFHAFVANGIPSLNLSGDTGLLIGLGKCLAAIAYGQLVAENCIVAGAAPPAVSLMFHGLVEDLSAEVLRLMAMLPAETSARALLKRAVRIPRTAAADFESAYAFLLARFEGPEGQ
jgi:acyl-CoA dehydrogenase